MNLESIGGWDRHGVKLMLKENQTSVAIDKCLVKTPDVKVKVLETACNIICESYIAVHWGSMWFGGGVERNL
jgi:hypothetical protein